MLRNCCSGTELLELQLGYGLVSESSMGVVHTKGGLLAWSLFRFLWSALAGFHHLWSMVSPVEMMEALRF